MITCNKCGYDKAVQGLNEIWCDKCDENAQFEPIVHGHTCTILDDAKNELGLRRLSADGCGPCKTSVAAHSEHMRLHAEMMRNDAAHMFARKESIWDRADRYFDKQDISVYVNAFFYEEMPEAWLSLSHGRGSRDNWSAVIATNSNQIASYTHKSLESLCDVLEMALYTHDEAMEKSLMDVVRTAIEDYFEEK